MAKKTATVQQQQTTPVEAGSVVRLRSGGPAMTVTALQADRGAHVMWFSDSGQMHSQLVPLAALVMATAEVAVTTEG